jgi:outer membrane biosynthesis protein TonB
MNQLNTLPLTPFYRQYDLPWSPKEDVERRFKKILRIVLAVFVVLAILVTLLPIPEQTRVKAPDIPDRVVQLLLEKKPVPPPPPPPEVKPEVKPEPVKVEPKPKPVEDARQKAQKSGLLKLQDQLADLRDNTVLDKAAMTKNLTGKVNETTSAERSMITSKVGTSSGGINTASLSRGYGTGAGSLEGHNTTQVTSAVLSAKPDDSVRRGAGSTKATRSEEEIATVFDRNKGAIYSIYTRALRDKPELKGKLVFELTISPAGEITKCDVVSSELNDPELERKLVARIKLFRFEARDVGTITVTKPIDFFPA